MIKEGYKKSGETISPLNTSIIYLLFVNLPFTISNYLIIK